mgnify:FL=1
MRGIRWRSSATDPAKYELTHLPFHEFFEAREARYVAWKRRDSFESRAADNHTGADSSRRTRNEGKIGAERFQIRVG